MTDQPCYHTGKGNFFIIRDMVAQRDYEIYFNVSRLAQRVAEAQLRLFVESAYVRDLDHGTARPRLKKINFFHIAYNRLHNKPIRSP
ncbi:hypothetical protein [Saccharospirillum mangrovi]|uniref:hypothetical protein n=1 Tax=Saccharospirillum mangrovi TaxID=2161747 RepID=UPI000D3CDACA|nr:hypothetical protein [Saccharospirillum mangrovi]